MSENNSHHHHHHHSSSSNGKGKKKDATSMYRKKMFTHVERMLFIRRWSFAILTIIAICVLIGVFVVYTVD